MGFDLGHTISSISKLVMRMDRNSKKESNLQEKDFFKWLDDILIKEMPDNIKAINFNLYQDQGNKWSIELVGTSTFDKTNSDWACNEIYTTRENPYVLVKKSDWRTIENLFISFLKNYLNKGKYSNVLKKYIAIGVGFVDGDLTILYTKDKLKNKYTKKIQIKPYLVAMMKLYFPLYELIHTKGMFYIFKRELGNGLYGYIDFQREGLPYNQLAITWCGVGYNQNWTNGMQSDFIGHLRDISYLLKPDGFPKPDGWVQYGETAEEIEKCMLELKEQIETYVFPYFEEVKTRLLCDQTTKDDELMKATVKIMKNELPKEKEEDIKEIIRLMDEGKKKDAKEYIYDYKNYSNWHNLINQSLENPVKFNRYILVYLKDYYQHYF